MSHTTGKPASLIAAALATATICVPSFAQSDETLNTIKLGYASILFNTDSGELAGPPGSTPPGATADVRNTHTLGLVYVRKLAGPWSIVGQGGLPPIVKFNGAGSAAALGQVGSARAWFPAVMAGYSMPRLMGVEPYVGAGLNFTKFTGNHITGSYTTAFGGTSSHGNLKNSVGPIAKLGAEIPVAGRWLLDLSYTRYWIRTTAAITTNTPSVGDIERRIHVRADPDVFALMVGYRF